jgi:hypothetical protein
MLYPFTFPFFFGGPPPTEDADGCWIGISTPFEAALQQPMATYALEQLRQRFLFSLTTTHDLVRGARVALQMAFETEIGAILYKLIDLPPGVLESNVCERRRFLEIDGDMRLNRYLIKPALDSLSTIQTIPEPYVNFLRFYAIAQYPRYRTCTLAAALCLAKAVQ